MRYRAGRDVTDQVSRRSTCGSASTCRPRWRTTRATAGTPRSSSPTVRECIRGATRARQPATRSLHCARNAKYDVDSAACSDGAVLLLDRSCMSLANIYKHDCLHDLRVRVYVCVLACVCVFACIDVRSLQHNTRCRCCRLGRVRRRRRSVGVRPDRARQRVRCAAAAALQRGALLQRGAMLQRRAG